MNQILVFETDEMTAFGFFNINLNLTVSVSIYKIIRVYEIINTYLYLKKIVFCVLEINFFFLFETKMYIYFINILNCKKRI